MVLLDFNTMFFNKERIKNFDENKFNCLIVKSMSNYLEITLNRPNKKNSLNLDMINELALCSDYVNSTNSIRAVVYKASGNIFSAGLDLIDFKDKENNIPIADIFNKLYKPKLVILEGDVYAGGVLIVACANYVISKSNIELSLPEVKRGLFPFQVMDSLFRVMPKKKVMDWCIRGEKMNVTELKELNLIDEIEDFEIENKVKLWINDIIKMSPNAIKTGLKKYEEFYIDNDKIKKLNIELKKLKKSNDFKEGINAFKEKRNPKWK